MIRFYKTPPLFRWMYPSRVWRMKSDDAIFLTFDDGPHPVVTPWVLEELEKVGAKATFFCLGKNLEGNEALIPKLTNGGHLVANHSYEHKNGLRTNSTEYQEDVMKCDASLERLGIHNEFFRPPYGKMKSRQARTLDKKVVMWSHLSWDFAPSLNLAKSLSAMKAAGPGSILTFHDSWKAFDNLRVLLPELLEHFRAKGLLFKTLAND